MLVHPDKIVESIFTRFIIIGIYQLRIRNSFLKNWQLESTFDDITRSIN